MGNKQMKKGISLIVLVITIIVMIILSASIIIALNNNGIIGKAHEAVEKTDVSSVQELANTVWSDTYASGIREVEGLQDAIEKALEDNNINKNDYIIDVTLTGVTVTKKGNNTEVWVQKENRTVVKGNTVLNIGDYVNYVSGVEGYNDEKGWQVLGAENGELLIVSASNVKDDYSLGGQDGYEKGISYLNKECEIYGKGKYAVGTRSITIEDIDKITGYDKTTFEKSRQLKK